MRVTTVLEVEGADINEQMNRPQVRLGLTESKVSELVTFICLLWVIDLLPDFIV